MMGKVLAAAFLAAIAWVYFSEAVAADPADTYPDMHLIPWPKTVKAGTGLMLLTADSRIVIGEKKLEPLAEVLAGEIRILAGLSLSVTTGPARAGDVVLRINGAIKANEPILVIRDHEPARTTD